MSESPDDKSLSKRIKGLIESVVKNAGTLQKTHQSAINTISILALKAAEQALENCQKKMFEASTVIKEFTLAATPTQALAKPDPKHAKASEHLSKMTTENQNKIDKRQPELSVP